MIAEPIAQTQSAAKIWTVDDLPRLPQDRQFEILDGQLFEMPSPLLQHQKIVFRLSVAFGRWMETNGGEAFPSPVDLYVSPTRYYIPDFCFYSAQTLAQTPAETDARRLTTPPDVIIEILSQSTAGNDRVKKFRAYAEFNVPFYWILDPQDHILQAFRLENGNYVVEAVHEAPEIFTPQAFSGLNLPLEEIFGPPIAISELSP